MIEAIDALGRRVDAFGTAVQSIGPVGEGSFNSPQFVSLASIPSSLAQQATSRRIVNRLTSIEARLSEMSGGVPVAASTSEKSDSDTFKHLLQLQDRLMVELQAFGRKLDTANVRPLF
jgi:hypothetical protein